MSFDQISSNLVTMLETPGSTREQNFMTIEYFFLSAREKNQEF